MSSRIYVENLSHHVGESISISGWVYTKRSSGKIRFIVLRDGTGSDAGSDRQIKRR